MPRVLVADDVPRVRAALRTVLTSDPTIQVVAEAEDGRQAIELAQRHRPDIALLDIRMPVVDGLTAAEEIARTVPNTHVVMITTFGEDDYVLRAVDLGVAGFLLKTVAPGELLAAVHSVAQGGTCLSPLVAGTILADLRRERRARPSGTARSIGRLTDREVEVLGMLALGRTNAEIASELFLVEGTVKGYVRQIFLTLGVRNRVEAALVAYETGLLPSP